MKTLLLLPLLLIFLTSSAEDKIHSSLTAFSIQNLPTVCSVTNSANSTATQICNGYNVIYTFTGSCTIEADSCEPADLYEAGIVAGICAGIVASRQAKLEAAFLPPCE